MKIIPIAIGRLNHPEASSGQVMTIKKQYYLHMKYLLFFLLIVLKSSCFTQNSASLYSTDGKAFRVIQKGKIFNEIPQAHVLLEKIMKDTLLLELEFENKKKFPVTLYLLEQGISTRDKEFNYKVECDNVTLKVSFTGFYEITPLPNPLVPKKPVIDTSMNYKNKLFGHFCEIKDGKPVYFNNLPKAGGCTTPMPSVYMDYTALLTSKAEVEAQRFAILENVCRNNCISVDQLNLFLNSIPFELDKLKLVNIAYPSLTNPAESKNLEKSFRLESAKSELAAFLKNTGSAKINTTSPCIKAASQMVVDAYAEKLVAFGTDSERYEAFKKGYADLCYTTDQAAQLLNKFIHDREKLDAAKLLYFYCVDKNNFSKVEEVFSYKQTANELKDFLEKQR